MLQYRLANAEIMYQSRASVAKDLPVLARGSFQKSGVLFIEVEALDAILPNLDGVEVVAPKQKTFYARVKSECAYPVARGRIR